MASAGSAPIRLTLETFSPAGHAPDVVEPHINPISLQIPCRITCHDNRTMTARMTGNPDMA
eukprot:5963045-Karenia_brevis.AAC.1